jgi:hypothetical protein
MDIGAYNRTFDLLHGQRYKLLMKKHEFKYYRYCCLQILQNVIPRCQIMDFD